LEPEPRAPLHERKIGHRGGRRPAAVHRSLRGAANHTGARRARLRRSRHEPRLRAAIPPHAARRFHARARRGAALRLRRPLPLRRTRAGAAQRAARARVRVLPQRAVTASRARAGVAARVLPAHLPEYASEALGLGLFMLAACAFGALLEHPASLVHRALPDPLVRRALMGLAMATTLVASVHAPWGRRSGAHWNPAVTLAFWRLGRVRGADVPGYVVAQFAGGAAGVALAALVARPALAHPRVHFVVTRPGPAGAAAAFLAELVIAFLLFSTV